MKFLVTGATGTVGRQVVQQLLEMGHEVRALTRNPAKANFPAAVEVMAGDLTQPETLATAFEGITGVHLITFGGDDYAPLQTGSDIVALAQQAGVKRVTLLMGGMRGAMEDVLEASSLAWTFIQPVEFMSNMLEWAEPIRTEGAIRLPFVDRKTAIVHEADIAAVAAVALAEEGHAGKTYTITGSEVLTPRLMLDILSNATGKNINLIELSEAEAREEWRAKGLTEEIVNFMLWVYGNPPELGYTVVPTVEQVTGKPARTFAQWAADNADAFRVTAPQLS